MKKYKVVFEREGCIGAAACAAVDPGTFEIESDGRSSLKGSKEVEGTFEKEITEDEFEKVKEAAESCPVNVIHIFDEDGKRII